jgi:hypothetical protein
VAPCWLSVVAAGVGELVRSAVRYADDGVLLCRTREQAEGALLHRLRGTARHPQAAEPCPEDRR